jgi:very-short-patch-repair endonuclease
MNPLFHILFSLWYIYVILIVGLIAVAVMKQLLAPPQAKCYYERKYSVLSKAEYSFYYVLLQAVGNNYVVFVKMCVRDLVQVKRGTRNWQAAFNKIQSKHADFVLCNPQTLTPVKVIELDDKSHESTRARDNDQFKDELFKGVGVPLIRIKAQATYNVQELRSVIIHRMEVQTPNAV